jgi:hypothetical protein
MTGGSDMNLDDELEPLTVYSYKVSAAMDSLVKYVLITVIPDSYTEEFPSFSVFEAHSPWGAHVDEENIYLDPDLLKEPKDVAIGTIAHEFAHLFLGHTGSGSLQQDYEADNLAENWGFKKQIKAMRRCYGPPTDGRR